MKLVLIYATLAAVIALITGPIPGSSLILTAIETIMAFQIARRYGFHLDLGEIGVAATAIYGVSALLKLGVSSLLELVPFLGWFIAKPAVAFIFVIILGAVADWYFKDRRRIIESRK